MKILHALAQLPTRTGSGVYYSNVVEEFKNHDYTQAAVFAVQDDFVFDVLEKEAQYPVQFKSEILPFPIAGMSDVMPYENTIYSEMTEEMVEIWLATFKQRLLQAREEFNPDVVVLHHLWMLTSMAVEIFDDKVKIGICHNTDIRQAQQQLHMKEKYVISLHKLDAVFTLSDGQSDLVEKVFDIDKDKLVTIGGGFNQRVFHPPVNKRKSDKVELVFAAKIEQSKGAFELIKAFKKVSETKPNIHLDIIGTPNEKNEKILTDTIGDAQNINLTKITSQQVLADRLREKDIYVMASYFEGLALIAIECLACGLRVVSTEIEALMATLDGTVNNSGVIEYVPLPRLYDTDKPVEGDIPQFVDDLAKKLLVQIERIENEEPISEEVMAEINKLSWKGISAKINVAILETVESAT